MKKIQRKNQMIIVKVTTKRKIWTVTYLIMRKILIVMKDTR